MLVLLRTRLAIAAMLALAAGHGRSAGGRRRFSFGPCRRIIGAITSPHSAIGKRSQSGATRRRRPASVFFHKGLGVVQDDVEAAGWFQKAAEQGQAEAQLLLGTLFFWGAGVPHSYVMAFAWCEIAQAAGEADALECRDAALEHMTSAEMKQSFRLVTEWRARHWGTAK